ncbi:MAG: nucleotidyltransferase family protein [Mariprofundus sp.]|nr:nucleotidyltransferase family protein [Mariprofundus sp.]
MERMDRAVILAAGMGTRLKWMTSHRPKALVRVAGKPAIAHVIRRLVALGVREIAVNAFHHANQLADYLGDGAKFGCHICISYEETLLDSGGGVKKALSMLPGRGPVVVHNCDVLADIDISSLALMAPESGCSIALVENPQHHLNGDFILHGDDVSMSGYDRFTFAGVSVWDESVFEHYDSDEIFSLARSIREMIARGACKGLAHHGFWFDIGRPCDLMKASRLLSH